jgi:hypothetical protein
MLKMFWIYFDRPERNWIKKTTVSAVVFCQLGMSVYPREYPLKTLIISSGLSCS